MTTPLASTINRHPSLLFPWNRKGAARDHVLAFIALAEAEVQASLVKPDDVAGARLTLAWLRRLADMTRDDLP